MQCDIAHIVDTGVGGLVQRVIETDRRAVRIEYGRIDTRALQRNDILGDGGLVRGLRLRVGNGAVDERLQRRRACGACSGGLICTIGAEIDDVPLRRVPGVPGGNVFQQRIDVASADQVDCDGIDFLVFAADDLQFISVRNGNVGPERVSGPGGVIDDDGGLRAGRCRDLYGACRGGQGQRERQIIRGSGTRTRECPGAEGKAGRAAVGAAMTFGVRNGHIERIFEADHIAVRDINRAEAHSGGNVVDDTTPAVVIIICVGRFDKT